MPPLLPPSTDYASRDFDALRQRLIGLVQGVFPQWTDFEVASFGNILIEMFAFVGDVLGFYLDAQARESRLVTATQRKNVIALARMLGYRLHTASAATAELQFRLARVPAAQVVIPRGTMVRTPEITEPVRFQLLGDVIVTPGQDPPVAMGIVEHSQTVVQLHDATGAANLDILLERAPYLDGSARVTGAGVTWEERETLLHSGPNDRHFAVLVDQADRATLRFGNGVTGAVPSGTLHIEYKTGGGAGGNVEAGTLTVIEGTFTDAHGRPVQTSATNPQPASGGADRQTVASAKLLAPESLRALTRSVAREDFEIHARAVPGVARALMLTADQDRAVPENTGILYMVPAGGGLPTAALKAAVLRQVTEVFPCPLTFEVRVQDPVYRVVDVQARIHVRTGHDPAAVAARIRAALADWFRVSLADGTPNPNVNFGYHTRGDDDAQQGEVAWSDVLNVVRDTEGVRKLDDSAGLLLNGQPADVPLALHEFPALDAIAITDARTGEVL